MCGILAIARSRPRPNGGPALSDRAVQAAMSRLRRRGPDGEGLWSSPCRRILLGQARLAIQDLTDAGRQPMGDASHLDDAGVTITYNGEIYNAPGLRRELEALGASFRSHSDTEVLIHGFRLWGLATLLDKVRGMFAFVIIDRREPSRPVLHAAIDHAGMKPLVYAHSPSHGRVVIGSDCDVVLAALTDEPDFARRLDGQALCHVLSIGYCPAPWTVWRGVNKLGPGQCMTWAIDGETPPRIERYWSPPSAVVEPATASDQEHFEHLFSTIVDDHLLADVPVGMFLSAGLDSSAIALALARTNRSRDVSACTLTSAGIDAAHDEAPTAAALARGLGMTHRTISFPASALRESINLAAAAFDEPQGFSALLTAAEIARHTRAAPDSPTVILGGDGGDEVFAGYAWHRPEHHALALATSHAAHPDPATARLAALSFTHRYLCRLFAGFHPADSRSLLAALEPDYDEHIFAAWLAPDDRPALPHPRRAQRLDVLAFCAGSILPKLDRAAMHVALELRSPFLDRRMLEFSLARPIALDADAGTPAKEPLRRFLQRGADDGLVPPAILSRPKQGFSLRLPEHHPFTRLAADMLPASRLMRDGIIRRDYATFLPASAEAREQRLFTLCMMAAWYERRATP